MTAPPVAPPPPAAATVAPPPAVAAAPCPASFKAAGRVGPEGLACGCSPSAVTAGPVWGSDVYTADSSICRAALHAGVIGPEGGVVTVAPEAGLPGYAASSRNGVASRGWGSYDASFRFAGMRAAPAAPEAPAASKAPAAPEAPVATSACPNDFREVAASTHSLTCGCTADAAADGSVWGTDVYTADSKICRAAVHAGAIGPVGGTVTVIGAPGRRAYAGVSRNGVVSEGWGPFETSYRFAMTSAAPSTTLLPDCPENFTQAVATGQPLACVCPADATASGSVWGTDVYTADSKICRAAVHAGVASPQGGTVIVVPASGRGRYAGSARHGVRSDSWGAFEASYRFAPTGARP